jgi:hypothetical protein
MSNGKSEYKAFYTCKNTGEQDCTKGKYPVCQIEILEVFDSVSGKKSGLMKYLKNIACQKKE